MFQEQPITQQFIQNMSAPSTRFLCPLEANNDRIELTSYLLRDYEENQILFQAKKPQHLIGIPMTQGMRTIKYHFGPSFFDLKTIGTTYEFRIGSTPLKKVTVMEKHYFKDKLIKTYNFSFPFCMPNSTNSIQFIYELPKIEEDMKEQMINSPWETVSDTFYFAGDQLILHNKGLYNYEPFKE